MCRSDQQATAIRSLPLRIGPLNYLFEAHDDWGRQVLQGIADHLAVPAQLERVDRRVHLRRVIDGPPPAPAPGTHAALTWQRQETRLDTTWQSNDGKAPLFWTAGSQLAGFPLRFELPWGLIFADLARLGGGVMHAGLAHHAGAGLLFLAPPSGGKSTTLATAPAGWQVLSDDAALLWPAPDQGWLASPLPAWGDLIRPADPWRYAGIDCGTSCRLKGLVLLEKTPDIRLERITGTAALPAVHRALCEYPAAMFARDSRQHEPFHSAASLVRALACWRLGLPRHGDVWPLLAREAA